MAKSTRNVLVTGASRGLGLGIARKLTGAGYNVIALARQKNKQVTEVIAEAERGKSSSLHFVAFDLGRIDDIPELVRKLRKDFGPLFGLVNNAALGLDGALAMMHNSQIQQLVRVNTLSPIILTKYVVRSMMSEGAGRIVNVASVIGFTGYSGLSVYAATKASMIGFTRSVAREVGRLGINVNAVAPGFIDTDMTHGLAGEQRQQVVRRSALRRLADVEDVANAVEFLLGDKARSITGTVLTVDAGATA
jgi:3-oxoacyl-[acyl-carrier protein] reductase